MGYDGVHNLAARRSDTGADSYSCADTNACTCGFAYPRANADTNSYANNYAYTTAWVNGYACSYSYSCSDANTNTDTDADAYTSANANTRWDTSLKMGQ